MLQSLTGATNVSGQKHPAQTISGEPAACPSATLEPGTDDQRLGSGARRSGSGGDTPTASRTNPYLPLLTTGVPHGSQYSGGGYVPPPGNTSPPEPADDRYLPNLSLNTEYALLYGGRREYDPAVWAGRPIVGRGV